MKIKLMALVTGLLAMTSAWGGGDSTTYYAALKATVSSSGGGKVYAATANSASGANYEASSTSSSQSSTTQDEGMTFYAFAQADEGFEFAGWSATDGGTAVSTDNPYSVSVKCSSSSSGSPTTTTIWANFTKKLLAAFGITFETSDAGVYTVDGVAPANKTGLTEATSVKLASADPNFLSWKINGVEVGDNPYTATCLADTTISAVFLTPDQVAEATTYGELTAALANDGKKKITIPAGTDITIAKGATVTVPAGKQLVVNGSLAVVGTLTNSGAISGNGTIYKVSYLIEQGEINKPLQVTGGEWGNMAMAYHGYKPYYRVTMTTANTPKITLGTISGCVESWAVLFKGKAVKISKQSPKALAVTRDTADSASTIKSIADNANTDEIKENNDYVFLQDCTISGPLDTKSRVTSQKAYDCAGHKATISASKIAGSNMLFMNGTVALTPSSENQNSIATFINCSSMTIKKIKNGSPKYYFYDCGSAGAMASLTFAYYSGPNTTDFRQAYFYSGYYTYTFNAAADAKDSGGHSYVYNGSFSSDPTAYLQQSASPNGLKVEGTNPYKVVENVAAVNCVQVGDSQYASLAEAVSAVSSDGTLALILPVTLTEKLVVPAGKKITIDLNGLNLSGGSIENSGALRLEDNSGAAQPGTFSTPVVGKAGTIDITFGSYVGTFTMEGGVLTTHNGTFANTFAATEEGGQVLLKGGSFKGTVAVPDGYCQRSGYIGQKDVGYIGDASKIGDADVSYLVMGFSPNDDLGIGASDETLYLNFMQSKSGWSNRSDFIGREALWDRLAELRSIGEPIKNQAFEASISFDRAVDGGTVCGWAKVLGSERVMDMDKNLAPDEDYHILIPLVNDFGYTEKSFKHMFSGEDGGAWEQVHCGVENKSLNNIGTTVTVKFQIRTRNRAADYRADDPKYDDTFETGASQTYKFTGNGAIYGSTDYTSLQAALTEANYRGMVRLSKDSDERIAVGKVTSFTLDTNNFAFAGEIAAGDGYEVTATDLGNGKTQYEVVKESVAKIGETPYASLAEAIEAAAESGETIDVVKESSLAVAEGFELTVTAGMLVAAVPADGVLEFKDGTDVTLVWPEGESATDYIIVTGGRYSADPSAFLADGFEAKKVGEKWIVGVKIVSGDTEIETIVTTEKQESKVEELEEDEKIEVFGDVDVEKVAEVVEKIEQSTKVEGVKLTVAETDTKPAGIVAVVEEATKDATFAEAVKSAAEVSVKVEVEVRPTEYVAPNEQVQGNTGKVAFKLTPKATVTVGEGDGKLTQVVPVTNDMIDQSQKIKVSMYTGFRPVQVLHRDDNGQLIEEFTGDEIGYDEANGIVSVMISHFSTVELNEVAVDPLAPSGAIKVTDGFYQNAATYQDATEFYITSKAGFHAFRDLINQDNGVIEDYISKGFWNSTADQFYTTNPFNGKKVKLLCDVDEGDVTVKPIGMTSHSRADGKDKRFFYGAFDGCNHKISNLRVVDDPATAKHRVGLFGNVTRNGNDTGVYNLTIENACITGYNYVGGFVGGVGGAVAVANCHLIGSVTIAGSQYVGGILGHVGDEVDAQVVDCSVEVVAGSTLTGNQSGGIVGYMGGGDVVGCTVKGLAINAKSSRVIGGISGQLPKAGCVIKDCTVDSVTVTSGTAGAAGSVAGSFGAAGQRLLNNTVVNTHVYDPGLTEIFAQCQFIASGDTTSIVGWGIEWDEDEKIVAGTFERVDDSVIAPGYEKAAQGTTPETWIVQKKVQEPTVTTEDDEPIVINIDPTAHEGAGESVPVAVTQDLAKEILGETADVTKPLSAEQKTEIVVQLETKGEDGMTGWQKYAAGFKQTDKHPLAPKGKSAEDGKLVLVTSLVAPKQLSLDTGVKVKYILKKATTVNPATGVPDDDAYEKVQELDTPEFPVDVTELPPETYWKIDVEYTATKTE